MVLDQMLLDESVQVEMLLTQSNIEKIIVIHHGKSIKPKFHNSAEQSKL